MATIVPTRQQSAAVPRSGADTTLPSWMGKLRRRIILLALLSVVSYPLLTGLVEAVSLATVLSTDLRRDISRILYNASMYGPTFGLTAVVALCFAYSGIKRWNTSLERSKRKATQFGIYGVLTIMFAFPAFAIALAVIDALLHRSY